jgi:hypothetical protein
LDVVVVCGVLLTVGVAVVAGLPAGEAVLAVVVVAVFGAV